MTEFWEAAFAARQTMWGFTPAVSATAAKDLFLENGISSVLIPGIGYGRNAAVFLENGMDVTGIEISKTAIDLARGRFGSALQIHHGSVDQMPFDEKEYGGIFCYALIHLLDAPNRKKLIDACFRQLKTGGYMVFVTISKKDPAFGEGTQVGTDRFERFKGAPIFFFDAESVKREFGDHGLVGISDIDEPSPHAPGQPPQKFLVVTCRKAS